MLFNSAALYNERNDSYVSQFASVAIISSFTFKTVMLPSYIASTAGHLAYMSVAIMMLIDIFMYFLVYYVAKNMNILKERAPLIIAPVMVGIFVLSISRLLVLFSETVGYTSSTLFDQGKILFILLSLLAVVAYIVLKGGKVLSRLSQIIFFIALIAIIGMMILLRARLDFGALAPFNYGWDGVANAIDKHYMWYGDFIPLLFLHIVPTRRGKESKWIFPSAMLFLYVAVVGFIILCQLIYVDALPYTFFAFNKVAIFNKLTQLIGPTNFPIIISWLLMSIIKLSILTYACVMSLTYFIKNKVISLSLVVIAIALVISLAMPNSDYSHMFGTSAMRYVVGILSYTIPIVLAVYVFIKSRKNKGSLLPAVIEEGSMSLAIVPNVETGKQSVTDSDKTAERKQNNTLNNQNTNKENNKTTNRQNRERKMRNINIVGARQAALALADTTSIGAYSIKDNRTIARIKFSAKHLFKVQKGES